MESFFCGMDGAQLGQESSAVVCAMAAADDEMAGSSYGRWEPSEAAVPGAGPAGGAGAEDGGADAGGGGGDAGA